MTTPNFHNIKTATGKNGGQPLKRRAELNPPNVDKKDLSIPQPSRIESVDITKSPETLSDEDSELALKTLIDRESVNETDGLAGEVEFGKQRKEKGKGNARGIQGGKANLAEKTMMSRSL